MDRLRALTLIKYNHKFGGNEYIKGRISGIAYSICGFNRKNEISNTRIDNGDVLECKFTVDEYDTFINIIEELYPGLCIFDYRLEKRS